MHENFVIAAEFRTKRKNSVSRVLQVQIAELYGVTVADLFAETHGPLRVVFARHIAIYLMHVVYGFSLAEVARLFGRNRSTASHAFRRIEALREDPCFDRQLAQLESRLRSVADSEVAS